MVQQLKGVMCGEMEVAAGLHLQWDPGCSNVGSLAVNFDKK